jgi:hypothetical protein
MDYSGLFQTPNDIRMDRLGLLERQAMQQRQMGGSMSGLLGQVAAGTGGMLAEGIAGAMGMKTAQEVEAEAKIEIANTINWEDPASLREGAEKMKQVSPAAALQMIDKAAAIESGAAKALTDQQKLEMEGRRVKAIEDRLAFDKEKDAKPGDTFTVLSAEEAAALKLPGNGAYQRNDKTGKVSSIAQDQRAINLPTPAKDHVMKSSKGPDGEMQYTMEVIPGSPTDIARKEAKAKAAMRADTKDNVSDLVGTTIDDTLDLINSEKDSVVKSTGQTGAATGMLPDFLKPASRKKLETRLLTVKANVGFDRLQRMREESPTGGALGQVAVAELEALQATVGSLDPNLPSDEMVRNLNQVKAQYQKVAKTFAMHFSDEELKMYGLGDLAQFRPMAQNDELNSLQEQLDLINEDLMGE